MDIIDNNVQKAMKTLASTLVGRQKMKRFWPLITKKS